MSADDPIDEAVRHALDVTAAPTTRRPVVRRRSSERTLPTQPETQPSENSGSTTGRRASASESPTSKNSDEPVKGSKKHWRQPKTVREFAAQANAVATLILNGDIDEAPARQYTAIARTVAQAMSIEVARSRFLKEMPDLDFGEEVWEDE